MLLEGPLTSQLNTESRESVIISVDVPVSNG